VTDLILAAQTVPPGTPLVERIDAAAAAGFAGLGLRPGDRTRALEAGETDASLRARLADAGLEVVELEVLANWGLGGEAAERSRRFEERLYELGDALGARYMVVVGDVEGDADLVAERFAALCDRAAEHGLRIAIEFVPFTSIRDAGAAWEIVERAGRPNGGVLVDSWHHYRGAADDELILRIPAERIVAVQFDDADAEVVGTMLEDTEHNRRLPGEGSFDLDRFVRLLDGHGVDVPYSVEVLSDELHARSPHEAAQAAADTTRSALARARDRPG
jgi:sugar phosphate isomerase/epimerase